MNIQQLPSIYLLMGGFWFEMKPEQYTMQVSEDRCSFCFGTSSGEHWRLGTSFFKDWYAIHSVKNKRFGFAPHINSWRQAPMLATEVPTRDINSYNNELAVLNQAPPGWVCAILLSIAGISFLSLTFYLIFITCSKCRPRRIQASISAI